jgi:hypothetical protein
MKKSFIFLSALLTLFACSSGDPTGGDDSDDQVKYSTSTSEHCSYQVGFKDAESGNTVETNEYASIAFVEMLKYNWAFIPGEVTKPDNRRLLYSYDTEEYYKVFDTKHYYTVTHSFYAYYSAIVEWDEYTEYKEYKGIKEARSVQKDIKCTVLYVGCTTGTPSKYIPIPTSPEVSTYPAKEGEWAVISTGSNNSGGSSSGGNISTHDYKYYCCTTCYKKNGDSDKLYIYKKDYTYRGSWVYDSKGMDKANTMTIYLEPATIDGTTYSYYISNYGTTYYFNFNK